MRLISIIYIHVSIFHLLWISQYVQFSFIAENSRAFFVVALNTDPVLLTESGLFCYYLKEQ